jgi:hypothetical protein
MAGGLLIFLFIAYIMQTDGLRFGSLVKARSTLKVTNRNLLSRLNTPKTNTVLQASTETAEEDGPFDISAWFNPNTRGGVLVWSVLLILIPVGANNYLVSTGMDPDQVGAYVGFSFVVLSMVGWASTYLFRVANKDMTYARQLKDYENAVLQKRLEELADDEIQALMEEIDLEDADAPPNSSSSADTRNV